MTEKLKGIAGSMFAGKTELLLQDISRAEYANKTVQVFKPLIDDRWNSIESIKSHSGKNHIATAINSPSEILDHLSPETQVVAIDEIQFFDDSIIEVIQILLELDIKVIFAGLAQDFRGEPFGPMPTLLALSDEIVRPTAVCEVCGDDASRTQRLINGEPANYSDPIVLIGASQEYQARCPNHHLVPGKPKPTI